MSNALLSSLPEEKNSTEKPFEREKSCLSDDDTSAQHFVAVHVHRVGFDCSFPVHVVLFSCLVCLQ